MPSYRVSVPATLIFDVNGDDEASAKSNAIELLKSSTDAFEGWDVKILDGGRIYPNDGSRDFPTVEQVSIEDQWESDEDDDE